MAKFKPFKAILPSSDKVHLVASRSYVTYSPDELKQKLRLNPYSYIHILNPDFEVEQKKPIRRKAYFNLVKNKFDEFLEHKILNLSSEPAFYLYRKIRDNKIFVGWIGLVSTEDYEKKVIKTHENTLSKRVALFKDYLSICDFHAEPVLMIHEMQPEISMLREELLAKKPMFDFGTNDEAWHTLWELKDPMKIASLTNAFEKLESIYIADGHHRSASSAALALDSGITENGRKFFMAYCIEEKYLNIQPYHRYVELEKPIDSDAMLKSIQSHFSVQKLGQTPHVPTSEHEFGMYMKGEWYILKLNSKNEKKAHHLDTYILNHYLLSPIFGIDDERTDPRIKFIAGENAINKMIDRVDSHPNSLGFALFPIKVEELKQVADANESMPPKSTWVLPKLRSGLVLYSYSLSHE